MKIQWKFLTGDRDWLGCGGKWISQKFNNGEFDWWFVREIINWEEAVGEKEAPAKYHVDVSVVSPSEFQDKEQARESCSVEKPWSELDDAWKVELIHSYSGGAHVFGQDGDNYRKLFKLADEKAVASEFLFGFAMDRAQNKIGSTGWDFLKGDITAGLNKPPFTDEKNLCRKISGLEEAR
jgi:hypothetical protein